MPVVFFFTILSLEKKALSSQAQEHVHLCDYLMLSAVMYEKQLHSRETSSLDFSVSFKAEGCLFIRGRLMEFSLEKDYYLPAWILFQTRQNVQIGGSFTFWAQSRMTYVGSRHY
ncbi:hypothetical protein CHARACLAT_001784 [Characodon lateralis]|uniref:Uncharacterized protein n=1 Tax=Characodon lateralis TaxID=208331 RepID=A0ABU7DRI2_9TELE|nr:hypothetical protein [Characodon lateralis]